MDWVIVGLIVSLFTAAVIAWGLRAQRKDPGRKWPIIAVGLIAGLIAGLAIIQAIWMGDRYPHRRRAIDRLSVLIGGGLMMVAVHTWFQPPFGVGIEIESGYVELPKQGYAITLPRDWVVEDISDVEAPFGETLEAGVEPDLLAASEDRSQTAYIMTADDGEEVGPRFVAFGMAAGMRIEPGVSDVEYEAVETTAGEIYRIDAVLNGTRDEPRDVPAEVSVYLSTQDDIAYQLLFFYAEDPPADRWLGIVETLEYLDVDAPAGTAVPARRMPEPLLPGESDFDIDFPDHWDIEALGAHEWPRIWAPLDWRVTPLYTAHQADSNGRCMVYDFSEMAARLGASVTIEATADRFAEAYQDDPVFGDVELEMVELPAGSAAHLSAVDLPGWSYDSYYFNRGDTWIAMECRSPRDVSVVWLSFARTFDWEDRPDVVAA